MPCDCKLIQLKVRKENYWQFRVLGRFLFAKLIQYPTLQATWFEAIDARRFMFNNEVYLME